MSKRTLGRLWLSMALASLYVAAYGVYRSSKAEVWVEDGHTYVLFGSPLTYFFFRPLTYLDGALTGMRFHLGPHR